VIPGLKANEEEAEAMASEAEDRNAAPAVVEGHAENTRQVPTEAWEQFIHMLREKVREVQASEETRAEFIQLLLEKVRADPYPSREQLDLIESSVPPEMVSDYARVLMEKASQEPYPSEEILQRIRRMTEPRPSA
jgi:hypothetical protein